MQTSQADVRSLDSRGASISRGFWLLSVAAVMAFCCGTAAAQHNTGALRGQVLDPDGAAIAGADVTVTNEATGVTQASVTSSAGTYEFPSLLPGSYSVTVIAKSFERYVKT